MGYDYCNKEILTTLKRQHTPFPVIKSSYTPPYIFKISLPQNDKIQQTQLILTQVISQNKEIIDFEGRIMESWFHGAVTVLTLSESGHLFRRFFEYFVDDFPCKDIFVEPCHLPAKFFEDKEVAIQFIEEFMMEREMGQIDKILKQIKAHFKNRQTILCNI